LLTTRHATVKISNWLRGILFRALRGIALGAQMSELASRALPRQGAGRWTGSRDSREAWRLTFGTDRRSRFPFLELAFAAMIHTAERPRASWPGGWSDKSVRHYFRSASPVRRGRSVIFDSS
jgi:hypothetical protein